MHRHDRNRHCVKAWAVTGMDGNDLGRRGRIVLPDSLGGIYYWGCTIWKVSEKKEKVRGKTIALIKIFEMNQTSAYRTLCYIDVIHFT